MYRLAVVEANPRVRPPTWKRKFQNNLTTDDGDLA